MSYLKRLCWAVAIATVAAGGASAQTTGGGTTGGTTGGGIPGGGTLGGTLGGGGQGGGTQAAQSPEITSTAGGFGNSVTQPSNIIGGYFANPMYPGRAGAASSDVTAVGQPGGFGAALYGGTGTAATGAGRANTGGRTGTTGAATGGLGGATGGARAGTTGGLGGTTGGLGGTTGGTRAGTTGGLGGTTGGLGGTTGGLGGTAGGTRGGGFGGATGGVGGANSTNQQLSTGRAVAYTQELKFAVAPIVTSQLQTDLTSMIAASSTLSTMPGLEATVGDGGMVVLRGKVADEDEARLVANMILLTPGVKSVKNDLQFPAPPKAP